MKKQVLSIVGALGVKNQETKKYEMDVPTLRAIYTFICEKGLQELKIRELDLITATEELSNGKLAAKLAQKFNATAKILPIRWNDYPDDKSKAAHMRNVQVLEDATQIILLKKGDLFGGASLLEAVSDRKGIPVLVYNYETEESFTCNSEEIRDRITTTKGKPKSLDYKGISQFLLDNNAVAIDFESTGLSRDDCAIQIGLVNCKTDYVYMNSLISSSIPTTEGAFKVHGITDESRIDAPSIVEIYNNIEFFLKNAIVTAFNSPFDFGLLVNDLKRENISMPCLSFFDYMPVAAAYFGEKVKLQVACERLNIEPGQHDAAGDAIALAKLIRYIANSPEEVK